MPQDFEKLGLFYLGRTYDPARSAPTEEPLLYDSKDLTTHAVCVGMTGSGKTGLAIALLEEAAIDGIPAIAIDPKGDLGNLLLTFPELRASDFEPWIDAAEAARRGLTPAELAEKTAESWRRGLADWGQDGARIARFRSAVDLAIYTPGSNAGLPLSVLGSFKAPPPALVSDADALRERVVGSASGLLALLGIDADPIKSREHILLSNLLEHAWREGRDVEIGSLVREIQTPPFARIGVLDLDTFFPAKERLALSLALNSLLASPGFAGWLGGEALDVKRLLWTDAGKPRLSVLSIAHLGESERMFFVSLLLNEVVAWMRTQPGTTSLRAVLYMDEIFGYFPPVANPPSKTPMLTLLKQARAFGLGVVLSTQNSVDLDYKGLSNAGTWLLGRLQTERDKARVLEGLEGASSVAGAHFDRQKMEATLAGLGNRVFLMNNVHEDEPVLFQSRWALSYLRGPLTKSQIQTLMAPRKTAAPPVAAAQAASPPRAAQERPVVPPEAAEAFLPWRGSLAAGARLEYRPALLGCARVHYVAPRSEIDAWQEVTFLVALEDAASDDPWQQSEEIEAAELETAPREGGEFAELPAAGAKAKSYATWSKSLGDYLYRTRTLRLLSCPAVKESSGPGESEGDFRVRLGQLVREARDGQVDALRKRYAPKLQSLKERVRRAEERVAREQSQFQQQSVQTAISLGATVLGALFGRKVASAGTIGRATTAARGVGRSLREHEDVGAAEESVETLRQLSADLDRELEEEIARAQQASDPSSLKLESNEIRPKKSDVSVQRVRLIWTPWRVGTDGVAGPAWR